MPPPPSGLKAIFRILNNASKRSVPSNGLPARRIPNVSPLCKSARKNAEPSSRAGNSASPERRTRPPPTSPSALLPTTASNLPRRKLRLPSLSSHLKTALKSTVPTRPKPAPKTPDASGPCKIANISAMTTRPAGPTVSPRKETPRPVPSGSASSTTTASTRFQKLSFPKILMIALPQNADLNGKHVRQIPNAFR